MPPGGGGGEPLAFSRRCREPSIEAHSAFRDHKRQSSLDPFVKTFVELRAFIGQDSHADIDAGLFQQLDSGAGVFRVWVKRANNKLFDSRFGDD